jgi:frataxin
MSMSTYHAISDETMDGLLESLEAIIDSLNDPRYEVEYSVHDVASDPFERVSRFIVQMQSGVLTLVLGDNGTYVINKQPPNKQIWLSSPFRRVYVLLPPCFHHHNSSFQWPETV